MNEHGARCFEKGGGIPIGITLEAEYEEQQIQLAAGDSLVFYTDGVLETQNAGREAYGLDRLVRCLGDVRGGIGEQLGALERSLDEFARGEPSRDDVTIVGLQVR